MAVQYKANRSGIQASPMGCQDHMLQDKKRFEKGSKYERFQIIEHLTATKKIIAN